MTASKKSKRKRRSTRQSFPPLPPPTHARKQMQRKYYIMRRKSFQGVVGKDNERTVFMRSILEEFAYGNISPEVQYFKHNSAFGEAMRALATNEEKLLDKLNEEEKNIFQKYVDAQGEVNQLTAVKNMVYGYKLGLLMTAEAFITSGSLIAGGEDC